MLRAGFPKGGTVLGLDRSASNWLPTSAGCARIFRKPSDATFLPTVRSGEGLLGLRDEPAPLVASGLLIGEGSLSVLGPPLLTMGSKATVCAAGTRPGTGGGSQPGPGGRPSRPYVGDGPMPP